MKRILILGIIFVLLIGFVFAALSTPVIVRKKIREGLGPDFYVRDIRFNLWDISAYDIHGKVRVSGDALLLFSIPFMDITPSWSNILRRDIVFSRVYIEKPEIKISRSEVREEKGERDVKPKSRYAMRFNRIQVEDALVSIDLIKGETPVVFEKGNILVKGLEYPSANRFDFSISGTIKEGGKIIVEGSWQENEKDLDFSLRLDAIDFDHMKPYLRDVEKKGLRWQKMDIDAAGELKKDNITLKGKATLYDVKYVSHGLLSIQGIPAGMLLEFLKDKKGRLSFNFSLSGDIKNPHFSIQESIGEMFFKALAEKMGVKSSGGTEVIQKGGKKP